MRNLIHISRIVVGNLFIFSGIVKVNDPLGFSYKLEEYFIEFGMDWAFLHDILVPLAAILCIVEIILGVAVLVGYKMKQVSWLLLSMIIFFTILTFASAVFEIVRSCGCFGDAIPLTPWDSFIKDLILLFFIIILFWKRNQIVPFEDKNFDLIYLFISGIIMFLLSIMLDWYAPVIVTVVSLGLGYIARLLLRVKNGSIATYLSLVISVFMAYWAVEYLPFKDFRPYAVGKNLPDQMKVPENAKPPVYENILTYRNIKSGELKEMNSAEYSASKIWENKDWEWVSTENDLIEEGDLPAITDLSITNHEGEDYTDEILSTEKLLLIIAYDLSASDKSAWNEIVSLSKEAANNGVKVIGLSSAGLEEKNRVIKENNLPFDFYVTDGIVLKTIVRSNPGIVYLEYGTVLSKWPSNQVPKLNQLK